MLVSTVRLHRTGMHNSCGNFRSELQSQEAVGSSYDDDAAVAWQLPGRGQTPQPCCSMRRGLRRLGASASHWREKIRIKIRGMWDASILWLPEDNHA